MPDILNAGTTSPTTITVNGVGFIAASVIQVNGTARPTTFVNGTTLTFSATVADQATASQLAVTVTNPAPGGGTSPVYYLNVVPPLTPTITSADPASFIIDSPASTITHHRFELHPELHRPVEWSAPPHSPRLRLHRQRLRLRPHRRGARIRLHHNRNRQHHRRHLERIPFHVELVSRLDRQPSASHPYRHLARRGAINTASAEVISGTGFTQATTVAVNGATVPSTFVSSNQLNATFPASALATPGNDNVTVTTPAPGGGTSAAQVFTAFISIPNSDL